jgi:translation initiation factor 2 gamma subunit (eIF-2gamma)
MASRPWPRATLVVDLRGGGLLAICTCPDPTLTNGQEQMGHVCVAGFP